MPGRGLKDLLFERADLLMDGAFVAGQGHDGAEFRCALEEAIVFPKPQSGAVLHAGGSPQSQRTAFANDHDMKKATLPWRNRVAPPRIIYMHIMTQGTIHPVSVVVYQI